MPVSPTPDARRLTIPLLSGCAEIEHCAASAPDESASVFAICAMGRNPRTGETVDVPEKRVPYFKAGKEIRERLNK